MHGLEMQSVFINQKRKKYFHYHVTVVETKYQTQCIL